MRYLVHVAALLGASLFCASALADDEIVVTATRSPRLANSLPADVAVISAADARAHGALSLDQALVNVPGIQAPRTGPVGQQTSVFSGGFESNHTLVLFDGARIDDPSTPEGVFDAGQDTLGDATQIEVVQGPMSALYGSGALGGVVNILPRRGGDGVFNPRIEIAGGSFGTLLANVGADGTLGRLRYALTADAFATDGYDIVPERIATHTGEADGAESVALTGVFDLRMHDRFSLDLLLRQREARADFDPGFFGNIAENPEAEITRNDTVLWRLGGDWTPTEALTLRLSGGALETDRVVTDAGIVGDEFHGQRDFADALAAWDVGDWTLQIGATTEDETIDAVSFGSSIAGEQSHWGVFATAQGRLGALDFTAALRHDDYQGFGGQTTWRGGAVYRPTDNARLYASFGASYRAPSLFERFVPFFGAAGLRPESARTWEIGGDARWPLFDRADSIEVAALYRSSGIDDLIGFAGFSYSNVDRAEIDFAEARLNLRPLEWLSARISYANTNARDTHTDQALQRRPRHAWSAALEAEHGPYSARLVWRQVGARLDTVYDDLGFFAGTGRVAAYDIVQASASWVLNDSVKLYIAADNVLDETYEPVNGFAGAPSSVLVGIRLRPGM